MMIALKLINNSYACDLVTLSGALCKHMGTVLEASTAVAYSINSFPYTSIHHIVPELI